MPLQNQNRIIMIDTLGLRLIYDGCGTDLMSSVPPLFDAIYGGCNEQGKEYVSGWMNGLKMTVRPYSLSITGGSFCKWSIGDNYHTMTRNDIQNGIEKMSDILHLPMCDADVTRLDIGQNLIMKHPVEVYLNHLGLMKHYDRLEEPNGLYYNGNGRRLCFYDKNREHKDKRAACDIPDLYAGRNVLRYEIRFTSRIARFFNREFITASTLSEEKFYVDMVKYWVSGYKSIQKINDIIPDFDNMKTKTDFSLLGWVLLIERFGGQLAMLNHINEAFLCGKLSAKQAFDLRRTVNDTCSVQQHMTSVSDAIKELDSKIMQASRYYR